MDKVQLILQLMNDNNIKVIRWYTIDNLFYCVLYSVNDDLIKKMKHVFKECDWFASYNQFAIDMDKQPNVISVYPVIKEVHGKRIKAYRDEKISIDNIKFEL